MAAAFTTKNNMMTAIRKYFQLFCEDGERSGRCHLFKLTTTILVTTDAGSPVWGCVELIGEELID